MGFLQHLFTLCCHHSSISESPCKVGLKVDKRKTAAPTKGLLHPQTDIHLKCSSTSSSPIETTRKENYHCYQITKSSSSLPNILIKCPSTANQPFPLLSRLPDTLSEFECCQILQNTLGFDEIKHLAEGFYSTVFTVQTDEHSYACKSFLFGQNWSSNDRIFDFRRENFSTEAALLRRLSHEHIIKWFYSFQVYCQEGGGSDFELSLQSHERCNYECQKLLLSGHLLQLVHLNLAQWMDNRQEGRRKLEADQVRLMFDQIGSALQYLHSSHYTCHLDLKPANIGVEVSGDHDFSRLLLLDFGNSITYSQTEFEHAERLSVASNIEATDANSNTEISQPTTNPFLLEAYHFSCLLMLTATFDVIWKSCADIRDNFSRQCNSNAQTSQLDHLLLQMSIKNKHISINWAINWLGGKN